ncbi:aspartate/glutamate racemase family protein [Arthrobacter sp. SLBN-122]|uniref:aspartate/glutamate racemase family protein n=1 Tax=Arthrobacter sp. SLBN-122 TaxID=2768455 RepID=UPI0011503613|nr:amino acid racemase [Arthrobacter sp. SLBN-122]TQJ34197.1 aspartate racemase [Arthrobacter sp. SLBN-122]
MRKKIPGLIGLAPKTNCVYYLEMTQSAANVDPAHTPNSLLWTINFEEAARAVGAGNLEALNALLIDAGKHLAAGGADFLVLTSNTSHSAVQALEAETALPVLDIRSVMAQELQRRHVQRVGILSTSLTQSAGLYEEVFPAAGFSIEYPDRATAAHIDQVIFNELVKGITDGDASAVLKRAAAQLRDRGAQAILLACTDMTIVADQLNDADIIDTTTLHARAAGEFIFAKDAAVKAPSLPSSKAPTRGS